MSPREAFLGLQEVVAARETVGRIAAESLAAYPPGIPNVLPGERLTAETLEYIQIALEQGGSLRGASDRRLQPCGWWCADVRVTGSCQSGGGDRYTRVPDPVPGPRSVRPVTEGGKWQMVAWAVAAALVVIAGVRMLGRHDPAPPPVKVGRELAPAGPQGAAHPGRKGELYVHVAGAVRRPGLLRVPGGARVAAAIARAGGPARSADLTGVNLAQPLEDGQQVIVPRRGRAGGPAQSTAAAGGGTAAPGGAGAPAGESTPSLATATLEQLDGLDGVGPTLAKRIVDYREAHGGFRSLGELREVDGIGEKRFATLRKGLRP